MSVGLDEEQKEWERSRTSLVICHVFLRLWLGFWIQGQRWESSDAVGPRQQQYSAPVMTGSTITFPQSSAGRMPALTINF